jgi:hypothetical protein
VGSKKQEARSGKQEARKQEARSKKWEASKKARSKKQEARSKKQEARSKKQESRTLPGLVGLSCEDMVCPESEEKAFFAKPELTVWAKIGRN